VIHGPEHPYNSYSLLGPAVSGEPAAACTPAPPAPTRRRGGEASSSGARRGGAGWGGAGQGTLLSRAIQNPIHYKQHKGRLTAPGGPRPSSVGTPTARACIITSEPTHHCRARWGRGDERRTTPLQPRRRHCPLLHRRSSSRGGGICPRTRCRRHGGCVRIIRSGVGAS
jgi:hypothetical protein